MAAPYAQTLLDTLCAQGFSLVELADALNLDTDQVISLPERVPTAWYLHWIAMGAQRNADFGLLLGARIKLASYPLLGMALLCSKDLRQTLHLVIEFEGLIHDLGTTELVESAQAFGFIWTPNPTWLPDPAAPVYRAVVDSIFSAIDTFAEWMLGFRVVPQSISLMYPQPKALTEFTSRYQGTLHFNAPHNALWCDAAILEQPVNSGDADTLSLLQSQLYQRQRQQHLAGQPALIRELREALVALLPHGDAQLRTVAARMAMSPRTLQRRLDGLQRQFREELDTVRQELAQHYLRETTVPLADIAARLGYREQSSFTHAFKEWTGLTPGEYRAQLTRRMASDSSR